MKRYKIALFGFGVVGKGFYELYKKYKPNDFVVEQIIIKNKNKPREKVDIEFTDDASAVWNNEDINLVIELTNDYSGAYNIIRNALINKKDVISANKKVIAENFIDLHQLAIKHGAQLFYEAAVAGSIPIISNLNTYYKNIQLSKIEGIINGSANYILSKFQQGDSYAKALKNAQELGFAELDPSTDVDGEDAANKLSILTGLAFDTYIKPNQIVQLSIRNVNDNELNILAQYNLKLKQISFAKIVDNQLVIAVLPSFIKVDDKMSSIKNEFNAIQLIGDAVEEHILVGKGAGSLPTGLAVFNDLFNLKNVNQSHKITNYNSYKINQDALVWVYIRYNTDLDESFKTSLLNEKKIEKDSYLAQISFQSLSNFKSYIDENNVFIAEASELVPLFKANKLTVSMY